MAYTPLRIKTVKPGRELSFDLYIFFKETYLCYAQRGESLTEEKFPKLRKQKMAKFFIHENDEENYQKFLDSLLNETINDDNASVEEKVNVAEGACETALERMQENPESEANYKMTTNAAKSLRQVITKNPDALKKIFGAEDSEEKDLIIRHSLQVSALATKLAELKGFSDQELDDVATAGLMHDVGVLKIPEDDQKLFFKKKADLTAEEKIKYGQHCKDAIQVLVEKPYINKQVINLVINHEETLSGSGPNKKSKLEPLEEIISLANSYDKRISIEKMTPLEALKAIQIDELGNYDLKLINKFKSVLKNEGLAVD